MKVKIEDDYSTSVYNFGEVDNKHEFMVTTGYDSKSNTHKIDSVIWTGSEPKRKGTAERRIKELALKINAK